MKLCDDSHGIIKEVPPVILELTNDTCKVDRLILHVISSRRCNLSCPGCYLTNEIRNKRFNIDITPLSLHYVKAKQIDLVVYINNGDLNKITRNQAITEDKLTLATKNISLDISNTTLVIDSSYVKQYMSEICFIDHINLEESTLSISPRSKTSVITVFKSRKLKKSFKHIELLFTVGLDNIDYLHESLANGCKRVALNIKKPYNEFIYFSYTEILNQLSSLKRLGNIDHVSPDACLHYINTKRDCHKPTDNILEFTYVLEEKGMYTCAYTSDTCIAKPVR